MVSNFATAMIGLSILLSVGMPVGLLVYFLKKERISLRAVICGMLTFTVFAQMLEQVLHYFVIGKGLITGGIALAVYGALAAGVFEEAGRYIMFILLLKEYRDWKDGVAFGIGHGGIEAILIGVSGNIQNMMFAQMINGGTLESSLAGQVPEATLAQIKSALINTNPMLFAVSGFERVMALTVQIALSVLVLYAVRQKQVRYFLLAILLHALLDFPAGLYQTGFINNVWVPEAIVLVFSIAAVTYIIKSREAFK